MNKVTKGTLAAAAAGALLLGGVGTYATWSDSDTVDAGTVASGHLTLTSDDALTATQWTYADGTVAPATPTMVPGDVLTTSYTVTMDATGDNMQGKLAIAGFNGSAHPNITVALAADPATLASGVTASGNTITFNDAVTDTITVNVTITAGANAEQDARLDLTALGLELTQTPYVAPTV